MDTQQIEQKWELEKQSVALYLEIRKLPRLDELKGHAAGARNRVTEFIKKISPKQPSGYEVVELKDLKNIAEELTDQVEKVGEKKEELTKKLAKVDSELANIPKLASGDDLLKIQSKKNELSVEIESIKATINRLEVDLKRETNPGHPLLKLTSKKEALLADVALGKEVDDKLLKNIEDQISEEENKHSDQVDSSIETAHTVSGLRSKLNKLEKEFHIVEKLFLDVFRMFLLSELETEGHEYAALSKQISTSFMKIVSTIALLKELGGSAGGATFGWIKFEIPSFKLAACQKKGSGGHRAYMFDYDHADKKQAIKEVKNELAEQGYELPAKIACS